MYKSIERRAHLVTFNLTGWFGKAVCHKSNDRQGYCKDRGPFEIYSGFDSHEAHFNFYLQLTLTRMDEIHV